MEMKHPFRNEELVKIYKEQNKKFLGVTLPLIIKEMKLFENWKKEFINRLKMRLEIFRNQDSKDDCKTIHGMNVYGYDLIDWEILMSDINELIGDKLVCANKESNPHTRAKNSIKRLKRNLC